jgi:hypothetical protein
MQKEECVGREEERLTLEVNLILKGRDRLVVVKQI